MPGDLGGFGGIHVLKPINGDQPAGSWFVGMDTVEFPQPLGAIK